MALFADATGLIALGEMQWISLLGSYDSQVLISQAVRREVKRSSRQIDTAIDAGWLHVLTAESTPAATLRELRDLDAGEAETIMLLGQFQGERASVLIDEGRAFRFLNREVLIPRRRINVELIRLAQLLHFLEDVALIPSPWTAESAMNEMLGNEHFAWASNVREFYLNWCKRDNRIPLPG